MTGSEVPTIFPVGAILLSGLWTVDGAPLSATNTNGVITAHFWQGPAYP